MDLGVTNRAGARLGPRAVRAVERIGPYEHALRIAPHLHLSAADIGDVRCKAGSASSNAMPTSRRSSMRFAARE
jgi:agmatinase